MPFSSSQSKYEVYLTRSLEVMECVNTECLHQQMYYENFQKLKINRIRSCQPWSRGSSTWSQTCYNSWSNREKKFAFQQKEVYKSWTDWRLVELWSSNFITNHVVQNVEVDLISNIKKLRALWSKIKSLSPMPEVSINEVLHRSPAYIRALGKFKTKWLGTL